MTQEEFVFKSNIVHNYFFKDGYFKVDYKNNKTKVIIVCPNHGDIEIRPDAHLRGVKCKFCSDRIKYNKDTFINKSNKIHNNYYNYSLVEYVDIHTKVKIICPIHGIFEQLPKKHLQSQGCSKCSKNCQKNFDYYLEKFNDLYNGKYLYKNDFINLRTKIDICCNEHGWFKKSISEHLNGQMCPYCNYKYSKDDFIKKSNIIHNNYYDYSLVEYKNNKTNIKIICPIHGVFEQRPSQHLIGKGCRKCCNIKLRIKSINRIENNKNNGYQIQPNFNKDACKIFDDISIKEGIHIQHAMNGGEFYIKELGYWVDGYDKENNTIYEFDEKYHFDKDGNLKEKDTIRQKEIEYCLKCKIIRIR
ncbi:hypothetical protein M0Q50_01125 [bacterium]|jgi:hypothetical protein|nr:hypothetical protein [bacterium]